MPSEKSLVASHERRSSVVENYLLSLYILVEEKRSPTLTQLAAYIRRLPLAEGLGSSLPTVLGVIRRMSRDGLLKVSQQKEIQQISPFSQTSKTYHYYAYYFLSCDNNSCIIDC